MEHSFQDQLARVDRLMTIIEAKNPHNLAIGLQMIDITIFACQSMWHLKDWILNDSDFGAKDKNALKKDIHSSRCLLVCADLANGSKHLSLDRPKIGGRIADYGGVILNHRREFSANCSMWCARTQRTSFTEWRSRHCFGAAENGGIPSSIDIG